MFRDLVVPFATPDSEINLVNPNVSGLSVVVRLFRADGLEMGPPAVRLVNGKGGLKETLSRLFPSASLASAAYVRLTCTLPFAASVIGRNYLATPSWAAVNAVDAASTRTQFFLPHFVTGGLSGASYRAVLGITNLSSTAQNVTISFMQADGSAPIVVQRALAANAMLFETGQTLFGSDTTLRDGWVRVTFAEIVRGGVTVVPPQIDGRTDLFFAHIADLAPWMTGIAILNASPGAAEVDLTAANPDGSVIGTVRLSIPAMSKTARLLREWLPQMQARRTDGGTIRVRSNVPIFAVALFFRMDLRILAGITSAP
jgi:hypothetical protein